MTMVLKELPDFSEGNTIKATNVILIGGAKTELVKGIGVLVGDTHYVCDLAPEQALAIASAIIAKFSETINAAMAETADPAEAKTSSTGVMQ